jgi:integrase
MEDISINKVDSKKIEKFMTYLREDHLIRDVAGVPIKPRKLSSKTLRNCWATLSVFWKWVVKEFEIDNPFKVAPIKAHTKPVYPLKKDELSRLIKACKVVEKHPKERKSYTAHRSTFKRDRAIVFTLLDTGVRASELCGISVEDVDLDVCRQTLWDTISFFK